MSGEDVGKLELIVEDSGKSSVRLLSRGFSSTATSSARADLSKRLVADVGEGVNREVTVTY